MSQKVEIDLSELMRLYYLLEELVAFFHQPMHYPDIEAVNKFLGDYKGGIYKEMADMYYEVVWNWLPSHIKDEINEHSPGGNASGDAAD